MWGGSESHALDNKLGVPLQPRLNKSTADRRPTSALPQDSLGRTFAGLSTYVHVKSRQQKWPNTDRVPGIYLPAGFYLQPKRTTPLLVDLYLNKDTTSSAHTYSLGLQQTCACAEYKNVEYFPVYQK